MKLKNIFILILILLMFTNIASATWADNNLPYKTNVSIVDGARPYQLSLNLSNSTGTNNATHVFTNGHANINFTDIRFYLSDTTPLSYWIENNTTGRVWINVTANGSVQMYYGNTTYTSLSNGNNTFIQWSGATSSEFIYPTQSTITNVAFETIARQANINSNVWWGMATSMTDSPVDGQFVKLFSTNYYNIVYNNSASTSINTAGFITANRYYRMKFTRNTTTFQGYIDNTVFMTPITTNLPDASMGIGMNFQDANGGDQLFSFLRYYFTPEPQWGIWGGQETLYSNNYTNNANLTFSVLKNTPVKFMYNGTVSNWYVNGTSYGLTTNTFNYTFTSDNTTTSIIVDPSTGLNITWNVTSLVYPLELMSPANGSIVTSPVTLSWREWTLNNPYTYQISSDASFLNIITTTSVSGTTTEIINDTVSLNTGTYYWRVKSSTSNYTNISNFTISSVSAIPGGFNITVWDEQNISHQILNYSVNLFNSTTEVIGYSDTTTGWTNFSTELAEGEYLIIVTPNGTFNNYLQRMVLANSPGNVTMYVPNSSSPNTINTVVFSLLDVTGFFPYATSTISVYRGGLLQDKAYFGVDGTHAVNLIQGQNYGIIIQHGNSIFSSNYIPYTTGTFQITINDFSSNLTSVNPFTFNITHDQDDITLNWNSTIGYLNSLNYTIYQGASTAWCQLTTSVLHGQSICSVDNTSTFYKVILSANLSDGTFANYTTIIEYDRSLIGISTIDGSATGIGFIWDYGTFTMPRWVYNWFSIILLILLAGTFGGFTSGIGGIILSVIALILEYVNWFRPIDNDTSQAAVMALTVAFLIFSVVYYMQHQDRRT